MKDMYVEEPERLQGKPKRTIADYVESNGFLVPRRFGSLREARESKLPILVRSEHPQEYEGVSGLLKSFDLETLPDTSDEGMLKEAVLDRLIEDKFRNPRSKNFCKLTGQNESDFQRDVSFSLWERLEGINRIMVADSSISERYHIMTCKFGKKEKRGVYSYLLFEDGKVSREFIGDLPEDLQRGLPALIELYDGVRNLPNFDSNHCPILEIQTVGDTNYFLQYHRTRDFSSPAFSLNRTIDENEHEAMFVRGTTSKEGLTVDSTILYARWLGRDNGEWKIPTNEDASFDINCDRVFSELMVRKRKAQIIGSNDLSYEMLKFIRGHLSRSKLFKPEVSLIDNNKHFFADGEFNQMSSRAGETGEDQKIKIHIVSDGRKAYVRRV